MRGYGFVAFACVAAIVVARGGGAQEAKRDSAAADARTRLGTVSVTAGRGTATVGSTAALVVPLDSLHLSASAPLDRALREIPFLLTRINSRGEAELSVRGSDSRQAAVLFDGLPLSIGWDHRSDASVFPTTGVGSVVVVRGLSSLLQGPNAIGGVIDLGLSSYRGAQTDAGQVGLRLGGDQVGARAVQGDVTRPLSFERGRLTLRAGGGYRDVPAMALSHGVSDQYTLDRDERANSDVRQRDGFVSARYQTVGGAWIGASYSGYSLERGVMPELHIAAPRFWRYPEQTRSLALVTMGTGRRHTAMGSGDAELVVGTNRSYTSIESFSTAAYDSIVGTETGDERTTTARLTADHSLGRGEVRTAVTLATVDYDEGLNGAVPNIYRQKLWSSALEVEQPLVGTLRLTGGGGPRREHHPQDCRARIARAPVGVGRDVSGSARSPLATAGGCMRRSTGGRALPRCASCTRGRSIASSPIPRSVPRCSWEARWVRRSWRVNGSCKGWSSDTGCPMPSSAPRSPTAASIG
jgi:iron complex outermembrane receptor protein